VTIPGYQKNYRVYRTASVNPVALTAVMEAAVAVLPTSSVVPKGSAHPSIAALSVVMRPVLAMNPPSPVSKIAVAYVEMTFVMATNPALVVLMIVAPYVAMALVMAMNFPAAVYRIAVPARSPIPNSR